MGAPTALMQGAAATLHAAHYVAVTKPSGCTGQVGPWPDPLIPAVDVFVSQKRNAFPLSVPAGQNRMVWVDVFVPKTAAPGTTTHQIAVRGSGGPIATLQLNLTVLNFTLPTPPTMASLFGHGADWSMIEAEHAPASSAETAQLAKYYLQCGLMNRVSFADFLGYGGPAMLEDAGGNGSFAAFVSEYGRYIDGVELPFGPSPGRLSSVQAPHHICSLSYNHHTKETMNCTAEQAAEQVRYWRSLTKNFAEKGWEKKLYDYTVDEPDCHPESSNSGPVWDVLKARAAMVHTADPRLRTLVTTWVEAARNESALELIDLWVPLINYLSPKPRAPLGSGKSCFTACDGTSIAGDQRSTYNFVKPGNLWTYQSCMSYGCGPNSTCEEVNRSGCELGWPSYAIDHPAVRALVLVDLPY